MTNMDISYNHFLGPKAALTMMCDAQLGLEQSSAMRQTAEGSCAVHMTPEALSGINHVIKALLRTFLTNADSRDLAGQRAYVKQVIGGVRGDTISALRGDLNVTGIPLRHRPSPGMLLDYVEEGCQDLSPASSLIADSPSPRSYEKILTCYMRSVLYAATQALLQWSRKLAEEEVVLRSARRKSHKDTVPVIRLLHIYWACMGKEAGSEDSSQLQPGTLAPTFVNLFADSHCTSNLGEVRQLLELQLQAITERRINKKQGQTLKSDENPAPSSGTHDPGRCVDPSRNRKTSQDDYFSSVVGLPPPTPPKDWAPFGANRGSQEGPLRSSPRAETLRSSLREEESDEAHRGLVHQDVTVTGLGIEEERHAAAEAADIPNTAIAIEPSNTSPQKSAEHKYASSSGASSPSSSHVRRKFSSLRKATEPVFGTSTPNKDRRPRAMDDNDLKLGADSPKSLQDTQFPDPKHADFEALVSSKETKSISLTPGRLVKIEEKVQYLTQYEPEAEIQPSPQSAKGMIALTEMLSLDPGDVKDSLNTISTTSNLIIVPGTKNPLWIAHRTYSNPLPRTSVPTSPSSLRNKLTKAALLSLGVPS